MFNLHNRTEKDLLRALAYGEGIISRDQLLKIGNKTLLSRYKTAGYLKQAPNASKGVFTTTPKFQKDYRRQIDPQHQFSGSGSATHSGGLNTALLLIPQDTTLTTGQAIKGEFDRYRKTADYHSAMSKIQEREYERLKEARAALPGAKSAHEKAYATYQLNTAQGRYDLACDQRKACSTPDLSVTVTPDQLENWIGNLLNYYINTDLSYRQMVICHQTIQHLQALAEVHHGGTVNVCLEVITGNYGNVELCQKENYAEATGSVLVYFHA